MQLLLDYRFTLKRSLSVDRLHPYHLVLVGCRPTFKEETKVL
jgi:hypothetical protein